jgi:hypothetical protein
MFCSPKVEILVIHDVLGDTKYELLAYGIPVHQLPCTPPTRNIKVKNHLQWIKTREAIDDIRDCSLC